MFVIRTAWFFKIEENAVFYVFPLRKQEYSSKNYSIEFLKFVSHIFALLFAPLLPKLFNFFRYSESLIYRLVIFWDF